jgi:hypothetical protein
MLDQLSTRHCAVESELLHSVTGIPTEGLGEPPGLKPAIQLHQAEKFTY